MSNYRYSKLNEEEISLDDMPSSAGQILSRQEQIIQEQDEELELVGNSVRTLRGMSSMIGDELDQQSIMLDDLGQEMEYAETRLDTAMKKMAKLTHLEDGRVYIGKCNIAASQHNIRALSLLTVAPEGKMQRFSFYSPARIAHPSCSVSLQKFVDEENAYIADEIYNSCHPHALRTAPLACLIKQCAQNKESSQCKMIMVLSALLFFLIFVLIL